MLSGILFWVCSGRSTAYMVKIHSLYGGVGVNCHNRIKPSYSWGCIELYWGCGWGFDNMFVINIILNVFIWNIMYLFILNIMMNMFRMNIIICIFISIILIYMVKYSIIQHFDQKLQPNRNLYFSAAFDRN